MTCAKRLFLFACAYRGAQASLTAAQDPVINESAELVQNCGGTDPKFIRGRMAPDLGVEVGSWELTWQLLQIVYIFALQSIL